MIKEKIINLTQHDASEEQNLAGVFDLTPAGKTKVRELLTFKKIPTVLEMHRRTRALVEIADATAADFAMIGGAPFFMGALEEALCRADIMPLYAFSRRVAEEKPDGTKTSVFRHAGFVEVKR